ncbi:MAG: TetR/AcrR family transcriptional regulator [Ignavibacteriales bacterium]|nr:TetR/AcrR family transcriptional regulator [Ignavibacteriales bacterium]
MEIMAEQEPKERIIGHAEERFLSSGFNKVTLDELSSELGISKKTMYKFFPSKEDLVRTMMRMVMKKVERNVTAITESEKPVIHKLAELMLFVGKLAGRISRAFQLDIQRFTPTLWKEVDKFRNEMILSRVALMIKEAKRQGKFRNDVNDEVVIMMFLNSVQTIVNPEVLSQHAFSPKEAMYTIFHVIFEGSLTDEARKEFINYEISIN